jgi:predicted RNase H-like HicB family nuclease
MTGYLVVIEKAGRGFSAYVPDLPGCVATGSTPDRVRRNMQAAIELHLSGLFEDGLPLPLPRATYARVSAHLPQVARDRRVAPSPARKRAG